MTKKQAKVIPAAKAVPVAKERKARKEVRRLSRLELFQLADYLRADRERFADEHVSLTDAAKILSDQLGAPVGPSTLKQLASDLELLWDYTAIPKPSVKEQLATAQARIKELEEQVHALAASPD